PSGQALKRSKSPLQRPRHNLPRSTRALNEQRARRVPRSSTDHAMGTSSPAIHFPESTAAQRRKENDHAGEANNRESPQGQARRQGAHNAGGRVRTRGD